MVKVIDNEQGFAHLWVLAVVGLLVIGGTGYEVMKLNQPKQVNSGVSVANASQVKSLTTNLSGLLTTDKVQEIAAQDAPSTKVAQIGLVQTSSGPVFHVQLEDGSSLDLDAKTGSKVTNKEVGNDNEGTKIPANFTPAIDFAKAEQIAQAQVTKGSIVRIELETEDGTTVYSVRFSTGAKVLVSALNGNVVKVDAAKAQGEQPTGTSGPSGVRTESSTSTESGSGVSGLNETQTSGSSSTESGSTSGSGGSGSSSGDSGSSGESSGSTSGGGN